MFVILALSIGVESADDKIGNYVFYLPIVPKSTVMAISPILHGLKANGHNVTVITTATDSLSGIELEYLPVFNEYWSQLEELPLGMVKMM